MQIRNRVRPLVEELEGRLVPSTLVGSYNWSGYALSAGAGAVTQVAGNWVVPAVASNVAGYSSAWVGIDGWSNNMVEQIGTDSDYVNGQAHYYAWYEMYPAASVTLGLSISPGDTISASVAVTSPGQFTLSLMNVTTGKSSSVPPQTSSQAQLTSAEWIQEAPSSFAGILPLANFGTINFSGANATVSGTSGAADNGWSGTTLYQVDMITRNGSLKDRTSALTDSGSPTTSSFSVTWTSSGSGGKGGGGHKSPTVPPVDSTTSTVASAAIANLAASRQTTALPVFTTTQASATSSPATLLRIAPALNAAGAEFAHFASDTGNSGGPIADLVSTPDLRAPNAPALPGEEAGDRAPSPRPSQVPGNEISAPLEMGQPVPVSIQGTLPLGSLDGEHGAINGNHDLRSVAIGAIILGLALDRSTVNPSQERARRRAARPFLTR
jgi:hypothetical protein